MGNDTIGVRGDWRGILSITLRVSLSMSCGWRASGMLSCRMSIQSMQVQTIHHGTLNDTVKCNFSLNQMVDKGKNQKVIEPESHWGWRVAPVGTIINGQDE